MRIGVTSQNFRTITGHAGKTRRFLIYENQADGSVQEVDRLDLPKSMSLHEYHGDDHPLFSLDIVITASCGQGFVNRLGGRGVTVISTSESDPLQAATAAASGQPLPAAQPHEH